MNIQYFLWEHKHRQQTHTITHDMRITKALFRTISFLQQYEDIARTNRYELWIDAN